MCYVAYTIFNQVSNTSEMHLEASVVILPQKVLYSPQHLHLAQYRVLMVRKENVLQNMKDIIQSCIQY